ncbi:MAG TPA: grasp-with-spasm system SPASM domain peptide maturase [Bacteroidales bacterium]|nr:grasp-with-spasm system SPASM domain peptide maturase [Bacteroidales bacterium]HPS18037.1 grasp-with-spasm system SPASM domain peptide maturase [Bacteroidales bacterium]
MKRNIIKFFTNCIPIKGYSRSIIYDIQRQDADYIPNSLYEIMLDCDGCTIDDIKLKYCKNDIEKEIIDEYFSFLKSKDYLFFCSEDEFALFPPLNFIFENPSYITNAIIEVNNNTTTNTLKDFVYQIDKLICEVVQLRILSEISLDKLKSILLVFEKSNVEIIELIIKYVDFPYQDLIKQFARINKIIVFSAPFSKSTNYFENKKEILYKKENICCSCGLISKQHMIINMSFYTEALQFNTCLNRKVCIDINGEIKNCPSMQESFGNIKDTTLADAVEKSGFKDLWFVNKDKIDVCKDCEFRYMCTDCRVFIKKPENIFSQPVKCTYNPYIAKWKGEEGYVPVEECGKYTKYSFVVDKRKVNKLNNQIL